VCVPAVRPASARGVRRQHYDGVTQWGRCGHGGCCGRLHPCSPLPTRARRRARRGRLLCPVPCPPPKWRWVGHGRRRSSWPPSLGRQWCPPSPGAIGGPTEKLPKRRGGGGQGRQRGAASQEAPGLACRNGGHSCGSALRVGGDNGRRPPGRVGQGRGDLRAGGGPFQPAAG